MNDKRQITAFNGGWETFFLHNRFMKGKLTAAILNPSDWNITCALWTNTMEYINDIIILYFTRMSKLLIMFSMRMTCYGAQWLVEAFDHTQENSSMGLYRTTQVYTL